MSSTSPFASAASALAGWSHRVATLCWRGGTATTLWTLRALRGLIGLIVVAWSVLLIAWLTLYWGILPRIEQWRPQIEARATQALGVPVRIGHIEVRSTGWVPALELRDVVLLDAQSREALRLPRIAAAVSARSLLAFSLRFEQLLIEGPQLDIRRDAQGRLWVAGLPIADTQRADGDTDAATDWLFDQGEFVIKGGALRWTDEQRGAPPLALSDVELVIRNGLRRHELRLDATPPGEWGERFSLRGRLQSPLLGRSGDWRRWSGSLYADLPRAGVANLRRYASLPFELTQGEGRLRAWFDVTHGDVRGATVDLALRDVSLRLTPQVEPLVFKEVGGRLVGTRSSDGMTLAAQNFGFVTGEGASWPAGNMSLSLRQRTGSNAPDQAASPPLSAEVTAGQFLAERVDLALLSQLATRVPLPDLLRTTLIEADPRGSVTGLSVGWEGPLAQPRRYNAKARFAGFAIASKAAPEPNSPGRPGWRNADIELQATEKGGDATLAIRDGALDFPGVFADSVVPLDRFDAKLAWRIDRSAKQPLPPIELKVRDARFANADLQGEANANWTTGPGAGFARGARFPGQIDLSGRLIQARAAATARYLPLGIPEDPRHYVARAVRGGTITGAAFKVKGDLWDFPYAGAKQHGEFRITGKVDDVTLAYVPPAEGAEPEWPVFNKVSAELVFDRASMEIRNAQAQVYGVALSQIQAGIRDMDKRPLLTVQGQGRGPLADMLRYVSASPVNEWTHHALAQASGGGIADLKLALSLPLQKMADSTVKGSVLLAGNDVRIRPDTPLLGAAKARVDFTHKGVAVVGGSAKVLGGDATFDGHTAADGSLRFNGQGMATADGLRRAGELGWPAKLATSLAGQAPYKLGLNIVHGQVELALTSSLVGMSSELPPPLRKTADAPLPLRYQTTLQGDGTRDVLRFELGNVVQAQFQRDLTHDAPQVLRGGIGVMEPAPQPANGVQAVMAVPHFNADAWQTFATRVFGSTAAGGAGSGGGDGYLPHSVAFRAQELITSGRTLTHVVAGLSRDIAGDENLWRANLEADQLSGYVEYRPARSASAAGRIYARLARLALPKSEADTVESLLDKSATAVPALDVIVDDFDLRGKKLGRIEIEAVNRGTGEWRLAKFNMITPEARFTGSGQWGGAQGARRRMVMDFKLELSDSGAYLQRLTGERSLRGGKGRLQGQLSWGGSPLSLDYPSLAGQINVALDSGQFLKAEPGAARLLGVLSLQSLPRRLVLDFRDVFQEGFAFDSVTGDVHIDRGQASTNNLRMRGVQAAVLMEGSADIERETQNLRVVVVPEINAGTASLAYAAINPAVGLGTFLAQLVLRKPIIAAGTREFRVTGPWADPKVDRIERKPGDAVPEIESPPTTPKS